MGSSVSQPSSDTGLACIAEKEKDKYPKLDNNLPQITDQKSESVLLESAHTAVLKAMEALRTITSLCTLSFGVLETTMIFRYLRVRFTFPVECFSFWFSSLVRP